MKPIKITFILLLSAASCAGQNIKNNDMIEKIDFDTLKKLDIEKFYLNQAKYKSAAFILNDTAKIQQFETKEYFVEYIMPDGSLFKEYNTYYKSSGSLYETGLVYKEGFIKGVLKTYNELGKLIKEEDYDAPFTYTFENILEYLKDNGIDINSDRVTVDRYIDGNENPVWTVRCRISDYFIIKTLDGRTGELLNTQKVQIEK
jgi:hypothetical protein